MDAEIGSKNMDQTNGDALRNRNHKEITHQNKKKGWLEVKLEEMNGSKHTFVEKHNSSIHIIKIFVLNGIVCGYFLATLYYFMNYGSSPFHYCSGFGSLVVLYGIVYTTLFYYFVYKKYCAKKANRFLWGPLNKILMYFWKRRSVKILFVAAILAISAILLYLDARNNPQRLIPLIGLSVFLLLGTMFSAAPSKINWSTVIWGLLLQVLFGLLTIRWKFGRDVLNCFADKVTVFLTYGIEGSAFVFSDYLVRDVSVFAFSSLTIIFYFSTVVEVLFYYGAVQAFCLKVGSMFERLCGVTICEGTIVVGNIFLGMTESILLIKQYLHQLTPSELHLVMSSGFATVSGTIFAAYISFGAEAGHLITASVMSAPAAIMFSKLLMPETQETKTSRDNIEVVVSEDNSPISAATRGATNGINLVLNIIANLIAFVSIVALINGILGYLGSLLDFPELNLEWIFRKIFTPLSWIMGVPWEECELVGSLIGIKTIVNEFVAYQKMGEYKAAGLLSARGELIATYSLCSFTNVSSAGIMIGGMTGLAPGLRDTLSKIVVRAFFCACAICFMTACIAGILFSEEDYVPDGRSILFHHNQTEVYLN